MDNLASILVKYLNDILLTGDTATRGPARPQNELLSSHGIASEVYCEDKNETECTVVYFTKNQLILNYA